MSWKKHVGLLTSGLLVVAMSTANGCSSSSTKATPGDGGTKDGSTQHVDSGSSSGAGSDSGDDSGDDSAAPSYDGTSGKACSTNADCRTNPSGPGKNVCSTTAPFGPTSAGGDTLYPDGVCIYGGGHCNSGTDGELHYCDGPNQFGSPGICLPTSATDATLGECFPVCSFKPDGSAVTGLVGKNTCFVRGYIPDPSNKGAPLGVGYSLGGCDTDADCLTTGQHCQSDAGFCVATTTVDLPPGTGCNPAASPAPTCVCNWNVLGFCTQFCHIGGSECTSNEICDAFLPLELTASNDASVAGWTAANPGLAGICSPKCAVDGGAQTDAGACYTNSTCQAGNFGGPDCLP